MISTRLLEPKGTGRRGKKRKSERLVQRSDAKQMRRDEKLGNRNNGSKKKSEGERRQRPGFATEKYRLA